MGYNPAMLATGGALAQNLPPQQVGLLHNYKSPYAHVILSGFFTHFARIVTCSARIVLLLLLLLLVWLKEAT